MRQTMFYALVAILAVAKCSQALTIYVPPPTNGNQQNAGGAPERGEDIFEWPPQPIGPPVILEQNAGAPKPPEVNAQPPEKPVPQPNVAPPNPAQNAGGPQPAPQRPLPPQPPKHNKN